MAESIGTVPQTEPKDLESSKVPEPEHVSGEKHVYVPTDGVPADVANGEVLEESEFTEQQYRKLTRKIDLYLIPLMFYCYAIQQTDKTSISYQAIFGLQTDTGLHGQQYQWLSTIFYITFMVGEFPTNYLLQRYKLGMGRSLTFFMLGWGICVMCISACNNWSQLMAIRALQGLFECAISPGFLYITGLWYRTEEHAHRALIWQSSEYLFGIIFQLMIYGVAKNTEAHGGLAPWRVISLLLGSLTIGGSIVSYFLLGTPNEVVWLNREEKRMAIARVVRNQLGHDATGLKWKWPQVVEAFKDPQLWFSFLNGFLNNIPNGAFTTFSTLMYESFGFDNWQTILWNFPRSAVGFVLFLGVALYTRYVKNQRLWIMIVSCIIPFIGLLVMSLLPNDPEYKWIKWGMYMMTVVFAFAIFLAWTLVPSNVAGSTKRSVVSAMTFIGYCVGNMVGSQVMKTSDAPRYVSGTTACCACLGLEAVLLLLWRFWYMYENRRRDRLAAESGISKEEQQRLGREMGEMDMTDWENIHFRYSM